MATSVEVVVDDRRSAVASSWTIFPRKAPVLVLISGFGCRMRRDELSEAVRTSGLNRGTSPWTICLVDLGTDVERDRREAEGGRWDGGDDPERKGGSRGAVPVWLLFWEPDFVFWNFWSRAASLGAYESIVLLALWLPWSGAQGRREALESEGFSGSGPDVGAPASPLGRALASGMLGSAAARSVGRHSRWSPRCN